MRDLTRLFRPRSVAIVGASSNSARLAGRPLSILDRHGFDGAIYPVNPAHRLVAGRVCYSTVRDIPGPVDLALIVVPATRVVDVLRDCGEAGIANAIVISSGFEETSDGVALSARLRDVVARYEINLVGPNSEGVWNVPDRTILTFGSAALRDDLVDGPVSVISQSGSIGGATVSNLLRRGLGCRYFVSVGNETTLGTMDFLEYVVDEGGSRVAAVYLEGLSDGRRFRDIAIRAARLGTAIVVLRGGRFGGGRAVAATHTGKIATDSAVYSGILAQCGVIEVSTILELLEATDVVLSARLPANPSPAAHAGVTVIAPGGSRVLIADASAQRRVPLARLTPTTRAELARLVPAFGSTENPVDVTGQVVNDRSAFEEVVGRLAKDPMTEALLVQYSNRGLQRLEEIKTMLRRLGLIPTRMPLIVGFLGDLDSISNAERREFRSLGAVVAVGPETSMHYLQWAYQARASTTTIARRPLSDELRSAIGDGERNACADALGTWEGQAHFLADRGIAVPKWTVVDAADWKCAATALRFPLAVKALPDEAAHKTDLGLVRLNIRDESELGEAVRQLLSGPGPALSRLLVQEMAPPGVEVLVSIRDDADFGSVLTVGLGGTMVELLDEIACVCVPCTDDELVEAIGRTRLEHSLRTGLRGSGPADLAALIELIRNLTSGYLSLSSRPAEIELNPVLVHERGRGATALDVLVVDHDGA